MTTVQNLEVAFAHAMANRPKVGGFPYLAEVLRQAGVTRNEWHLPSCQSVYYTESDVVVNQSEPLAKGLVEVPPFDEAALIHALRTDQAGNSTFPEFLAAAWAAGVMSYTVDFVERYVVYYGSQGQEYREDYTAVSV
ncbi:MAG: DUF1398 family protein [Armatimonas sp.]